MSTTTVRSGMVSIDVPNFPRLQTLLERQQEQKKLVDEATKRIGALANQARNDDPQTYIAAKREYAAADARKQAAERRLKDLLHEHEQWLGHFANLLHRKKLLARELVEAKDGPQPTFMMGDNQERLRDKEEVERDVLDNAWALARWSGDEKLMREAEQLQTQILASKPYVILENNYVRLGNGTYVTEARFQEMAIEHGSDVVSRGARSGGFGKGSKVPREEAARLNLS